MRDGPSYRFEPSDRRGVLLGLGVAQLCVLAAALLVAIGLAKTWPGAGGFLAAASVLMAGGMLCRPVLGRPPPQWLSVLASFVSRRRLLAQPPPPVAPRPALRLPARTFAPGVYLCELPATDGQAAIGAILDEKAGTAAALLRARGGPFCLLDEGDKDHRVAAWAAVLESVSAQRGALARLQWCHRAVPADSEPFSPPPFGWRPGQPGLRGPRVVAATSRQKVVAPRDFAGRLGTVPRPARASWAEQRRR